MGCLRAGACAACRGVHSSRAAVVQVPPVDEDAADGPGAAQAADLLAHWATFAEERLVRVDDEQEAT
eukprot:14007197-Alexandrium_andersonii.AAC.1